MTLYNIKRLQLINNWVGKVCFIALPIYSIYVLDGSLLDALLIILLASGVFFSGILYSFLLDQQKQRN